nr:glycosyltransferase family 2 protein [Rhizobium sp. BE258]
MATVEIDIAVCTYRRPFLRETLASLAKLKTPQGIAIRVIVSDNDTTPSARALVESQKAALPFPLVYLHSPASNISIARNACLDAASGDYLAFIDDDELVTPKWLSALFLRASETKAAVVLGPVRAIYGRDAHPLMARADFHSTKPVVVNGQIITGYTCNALIDRHAPSIAGRRFDLSLGRSGGEDTAFFSEVFRAGGAIAYSEGAIVLEPVTRERTNFGWLARRRFRSGQTHARLLILGGTHPLPTAVLASAKAGICLMGAVIFAANPVSRWRFVLRGILHAGVVAGSLGLRPLTLYGQALATGREKPHGA